jgi:RimJ/RimL family protein N-acetyltransferase
VPLPTTRIEPVTRAHVEALIEGDGVFVARFGMEVAPGYLDFPEALARTRDELARGMPSEWYSHLIIDADTNTVVGFGGYKGPPTDGEVEIGYSVAPSHQRRGHATAAARLLIDGARAAGVTLVSAYTLPEPNASTRVLTRCGLTMTEVVEDAYEGYVWRWELTLTPQPVAPATSADRRARSMSREAAREERAEHAEPGPDHEVAEELSRPERGVVAGEELP